MVGAGVVGTVVVVVVVSAVVVTGVVGTVVVAAVVVSGGIVGTPVEPQTPQVLAHAIWTSGLEHSEPKSFAQSPIYLSIHTCVVAVVAVVVRGHTPQNLGQIS